MKYVGIITAMDEELEAVKKIMDEESEIQSINGVDIVVGKIQNVHCLLTKSGAGKVNAARTTQILIDKYDISYIINVGVAGAINYKLQIGDITAFGHSKGYIPGVGNEILCDSGLVSKFEKITENVEEKVYNVISGTIATGDIFVTEVAMKDKIASKFKADCVEMEGAAIAQVCELDGIPFIIIRSISDSPNGKNATDYNQYIKLASKRSANLLKEFFLNEQ